MSYQVEVRSQARAQIHRLPGNMHQRILRLLRSFEQDPRPHTSKPLDIEKAGLVLPEGVEVRRVRLETWRIVYAVDDEAELVTVLTVRKRPPYRYEDLDTLINDLS